MFIDLGHALVNLSDVKLIRVKKEKDIWRMNIHFRDASTYEIDYETPDECTKNYHKILRVLNFKAQDGS